MSERTNACNSFPYSFAGKPKTNSNGEITSCLWWPLCHFVTSRVLLIWFSDSCFTLYALVLFFDWLVLSSHIFLLHYLIFTFYRVLTNASYALLGWKYYKPLFVSFRHADLCRVTIFLILCLPVNRLKLRLTTTAWLKQRSVRDSAVFLFRCSYTCLHLHIKLLLSLSNLN